MYLCWFSPKDRLLFWCVCIMTCLKTIFPLYLLHWLPCYLWSYELILMGKRFIWDACQLKKNVCIVNSEQWFYFLYLMGSMSLRETLLDCYSMSSIYPTIFLFEEKIMLITTYCVFFFAQYDLQKNSSSAHNLHLMH